MLDAVSALRGLLIDLQGVAGGSLRVGLIMANSPEWVAADLALLLSGAVEVPLPHCFTITGRPIRTELWKRMTLELGIKEIQCPT